MPIERSSTTSITLERTRISSATPLIPKTIFNRARAEKKRQHAPRTGFETRGRRWLQKRNFVSGQWVAAPSSRPLSTRSDTPLLQQFTNGCAFSRSELPGDGTEISTQHHFAKLGGAPGPGHRRAATEQRHDVAAFPIRMRLTVSGLKPLASVLTSPQRSWAFRSTNQRHSNPIRPSRDRAARLERLTRVSSRNQVRSKSKTRTTEDRLFKSVCDTSWVQHLGWRSLNAHREPSSSRRCCACRASRSPLASAAACERAMPQPPQS